LFTTSGSESKDYIKFAKEHRPEMLLEKYIGDEAFVKLKVIDTLIQSEFPTGPTRNLFDLALTSIIIPASNIRYGPGFGVGKPRKDVDVYGIFCDKINRMIDDLASIDDKSRHTSAIVALGDARNLSQYIEPNSVSLMITSPPYPGDHEYTK